MTQSVSWAWTIAFFMLAIGPLIFVHELGHYLVARWCGVKAEVFSIGFGKELAGWTDKRGTRWKLSLFPLGGYVRFAGDANAASQPDEGWRSLPPDEQNGCFPAQPPWKRMLIVAAGPVANFLMAFLLYTALFASLGRVVTLPVAGEVLPGSAAEQAGLKPGDTIQRVDGQSVDDFRQIIQIVSANPGQVIPLDITRAGQELRVLVTPMVRQEKDRFGNEYRVGRIGMGAGLSKRVDVSLIDAPVVAVKETASNTGLLAYGLWQLVTGRQSVKELGGPLMIAKTSGEVATGGIVAFLAFMAFLSINLGFINLLPLPVLDGGHLVFYTIESVTRRPVGQRAQELAFTAGFFALMSLMVFATINDLTRYGVFSRFAGLIG